ncbi:hypothetical protein IMG5_069520, partial [Ichthyophthirius multifiliis]
MSKNEPIQENAMSPKLNAYTQHAKLMDIYKTITNEINNFNGTRLEYIQDFFTKNQIEFQVQQFQQKNQSMKNLTHQNIIGIQKSQRTNNYECNIIAFDLSEDPNKISIPFTLSFIKYYQLPQINYVSRDIMYIGYDFQSKKYGYSMEMFLKHHFSTQNTLPHCGVFRQALNIDLEKDFNALYYKALGFDGKVPDLDYFLNYNKLFYLLFKEDYKYTEYSSSVCVSLGNFLEKQLNLITQMLKIKIPPNYFYNLKGLCHSLVAGFYGEKHDAHSQLQRYGVQAVTIKGKKIGKAESSQNKLQNLFYLVDQGTRATYALDEQLHAASTLYYPVRKQLQITIADIPYPTIFFAFPFASMGTYLHQQCYKKKSVENSWLIWGPYIYQFLHSLLMLILPSIAESIMGYQFCINWNDYQNENFITLFTLTIFLIVTTRILLTLFWDYVIVRGIFKANAKLIYEGKLLQAYFYGLQLQLLAIFYIFFNTGVNQIICILFTPLLLFARPLLPRNKKEILYTIINIFLIGCFI